MIDNIMASFAVLAAASLFLSFLSVYMRDMHEDYADYISDFAVYGMIISAAGVSVSMLIRIWT